MSTLQEKPPTPETTVSEHSGEHPAPPKRRLFRVALGAIWQFAKYMFTLPVALFRAKRGSTMDEVTVYSAHPSFYLWLLIAVGFISAAVVEHWPGTASFCGWLYIWVLVYFICTLLYDIGTRKLALWVLIFTAIWLASKLFEVVQHVALLSSLFNYLSSLDPKLDPGTVTILSWLLLLPWIGSLLHMALNGRKRFTANEIGEFHFGEGSELTDRTGLRFRTRYRDVLETILGFGSGDLQAVDNHQNVIKHWDNIVGLFFFWNDLDRVLHTRLVVEAGDDDKRGTK